MHIQPYLNFDGRCEEALAFYKKALGAEVTTMMRMKDSPVPPPGGALTADKIMHAAFKVGDTTIMASDGRCAGQAGFKGVTLSLDVADVKQAERYFAALSGEGGQVQMALGETFFAHAFGMLADKFGVSWMVVAAKPIPAGAGA